MDGHRPTAVATAPAALAETAQRPFDLAMVDLRLGMDKGMDLVPKLLSANPWLKVIVITAFASVDTAVEAIKSRCGGLSSQAIYPCPGSARRRSGRGSVVAGTARGGPAIQHRRHRAVD